MFTGIVEAIGSILAVVPTERGRRLRLHCPELAADLRVGASIAVDGACLTAVEIATEGFSVDLTGATLSRTIAGNYTEGSRVNLERALRLGDRLDGHLVQGHVDGVGEIVTVATEGDARLVDVTLPAEVAAATVLHGSIAVNGVSLTVSGLPAPDRCRVVLIPHTLAVTTLSALRARQRVNLEGDLIGKYLGRMFAARSPTTPLPDDDAS